MRNIYRRFIRCFKLLLKNLYETVLYHWLRGKREIAGISKIVFLCKGNICRSAFAECLMKAETQGKALRIESCGIDVNMRMPAPLEAKATAKKFGLDLDDHMSKGLESCGLENADLILVMEFQQYRRLVEIFPHKKESIKLLREFAPFPENLLCNINDPFGQSEVTFEKCFGQIKRSILTITARL
jgi:protein-tyrosine phosphatase